jgi:hypothetical protein
MCCHFEFALNLTHSTWTMAEGVVSGWLTKRGEIRKNWKKRYFVLQRDGFLKYYGSDLDAACVSAKNLIDLRTVSVITTGSNVSLHLSTSILILKLSDWPDASKSACRFALVTPKRVFYFFSDSAEEAKKWIISLNKVAKEVCNVSSAVQVSHAASAPDPALPLFKVDTCFDAHRTLCR